MPIIDVTLWTGRILGLQREGGCPERPDGVYRSSRPAFGLRGHPGLNRELGAGRPTLLGPVPVNGSRSGIMWEESAGQPLCASMEESPGSRGQGAR